MAADRGGSRRILAKLNKSIEEGNYYEAHQMYRTLYFRYMSQKKYTEAINLLYNGSVLLLTHNQVQSGSDLAMLLIEVLNKSQSQVSEDILDKVGKIHSLFTKDSMERPEYVGSALRWSSQQNKTKKSGHPDLHHRFALTNWREKDFVMSRYHFVHSLDGAGCATMLVEYHVTLGYPSEADLFIAQAVFQYLCLQNVSVAETAFRHYTEQHPQVEPGPPFVRPLLNFLWLLLLAIEGGKVAVFTILCENYKPSLGRDQTYCQYLDKIGQLFFGMPPPQNKMHGLFGGGLLQSLLNFADSSDEEEGASMSNMELD